MTDPFGSRKADQKGRRHRTEPMKEKISSFWNYEKKDRPFNLLMAGVSYCDGTYRIERKPENLYSFEYIYSGKSTASVWSQRQGTFIF